MDSGNKNVGDLVKELWSQLDGKSLYFTSALSLALSVLLLLGIVPEEFQRDTGKTAIAFLFFPVIAFFVLIRLRQLPMASTRLSTVLRAALLILLNLIFLFYM